ncbi:rhodanese-like domain-containing protein [Aureibaculum sp. 2210JD6-5]|uniref:rhodanese-like domain-containing protein n=1 Tax=Aureibaculum sp. 2210JD6-5 TaxID=3103957 RepID=UPI002AACCBC0|nr:rhodanese-like domain-containing protein [Aureibaculum sp. 2210JD6-5]MDY7394908.1 rhodanese-like domain-containing protein [Aureibaculum sp. 2210JD6-5]
MGLFNMFKSDNTDNVSEYLDKGAIVIDVRTVAEYNDGHVEGSKNIVLDTIEDHIDEIKAFNKPVITCCRSGARSGNAADILNEYGIDCINGGPWQNVAKHIDS